MSANYGALLHGPNDIRLEKLPVPEIGENDVLIEMKCVGICGSDLKLYTTGKCGNDVLDEPCLIGHEGAGVVVKVGANVTTLDVGDRVAIEPTQPCRSCAQCKRGRYNLCPRPWYCSSAGAPGNLINYYKHVADFCHKLPDNVTFEEGAAVQPLAIALHACHRAGVKLGDIVAVFGAGPIGVLCAMSARVAGASKIIITDVVQARLDAATASVDCVLNTAALSEEEQVEGVHRMLGCSPDVSIDACAFPVATRAAMKVTRPGGVVTVVGIGPDTVDVPLSRTLLSEIDIRGSYRIANTYPAAIAAVSNGAISLDSFITHHFPMDRINEAFELAKTGKAMKIIIHTGYLK